MRGDVVGKSEEEGNGATELDVAVSRVTQGICTLCLFLVTMTVAQ